MDGRTWLAGTRGDRLTTRVDGSRPLVRVGVSPPRKKPHGRNGAVQIRITPGAVLGGTTQLLVTGGLNMRSLAGEAVAIQGQGGVTVTAIRHGARRKRRKRKRKKMTGIRGGERAVRIGRPLSRTMEISARIGPSGGVLKAGGLLQFPRMLSRSHLRPLSRQLSLSPPTNTPTRTTQRL